MKNKAKEWLFLFVTVTGVLSFRSSFADQYFIPTGSMEPTIQVGDHVFVNKLAYDLKVPFTELRLARISEPKRGDIIVFTDPRDPSIRLIKRLIGLPGERVQMRDGSIRVVPKDHYYFLGDNRNNSADSRDWGFAHRNALRGKALRVLYNLRWDGPVPSVDLHRAGERLL